MQTLVKEEKKLVMPSSVDAMPVHYDPEKVLAMGQKMASALKRVLQQNNWTVKIGPSEHLRFEAWQTLGSFFGYVPTVLKVEPITYRDKIIGYWCRAGVKRVSDGEIISEAEATCSRDEPNWKNKPDFQLRSMAQTRACAKALRQCFSWIVTLAGYDPTPAEEMDSVVNGTATNGKKKDLEEERKKEIAGEIKALMEELNLSESQLIVICHSAGLNQVKAPKDLRKLSSEELTVIRDKLQEKLKSREIQNE